MVRGYRGKTLPATAADDKNLPPFSAQLKFTGRVGLLELQPGVRLQLVFARVKVMSTKNWATSLGQPNSKMKCTLRIKVGRGLSG